MVADLTSPDSLKSTQYFCQKSIGRSGHISRYFQEYGCPLPTLPCYLLPGQGTPWDLGTAPTPR